MKRIKFFYAFGLLLAVGLVTILSACGGDEDEDDPAVPTPSVSVQLLTQSIAEGEEIAATTTQLALGYSTTVRVATTSGMALNGAAVTAVRNPQDVKGVIVTLELQEGTDYTLTIPAGCIVANADPTAQAPAFTLHFKTKAKEQQPPVTDNSATALAKRLGWGWNLGNHFDTSSGQDGMRPQWGYWDKATPTQQLYDNLRAAGASTVRIGVTWGNYQSGADWTIDASYMAEVRASVDMAEKAGLNVILNMHHDEYWLDIKSAATNNIISDDIKQRITKTWTQIANAFSDKGDFLFFETFNEIQDGSWGWGANRTDGGKQYRTLNEWNQAAVDAIRATGGQNATRWIGVPGYASSPAFVLIDEFQLPTDAAGRLMVSVHFYDPNTFTLTPESSGGKSEWGHTAAAGKFQAGSQEEHVVETFQQLYAKYVSKDIPVYIGEYGCVQHNNERSNRFRSYYLEYVCRAAHTYGMPLCIWDNNVSGGGDEHHGYFNHNDGSYLNASADLVATMIKAATSTDESYTLETIYSKAP